MATITAVAAGSATITVTARDQGGLTATQRVDIIVRLVNRAPRAVGTIPAATLASGGTATVDASLYFTDPDGDALTYSATSSNPSVATASVSGSIATITAVAAGSATITVTARDQGGLAATEQVHVTVTDGVGLRDDFNSSASLADWRLLRATAVVNNGVLALTKTTDYTGVAARDLAESITSWTLAIRMGRGQPADSAVAVAWRTGHTKYTWAGFYIMPHEDNNYFLLVYDSASGYWDTITNSSGNSDAISVEAGELTTISVSFIDGQFQGAADGTELFNYPTDRLGSAIFANLAPDVRLFADGVSGTIALFDWIEISGDPVGSGFFADDSATPGGVAAREFAKDGPAAGILSTKSLDVTRSVSTRRNR
ncbi:MAG: hypothetical protein F4Y33_00780 [Gemmatimonadales bacterium]|nr:hypothetical protein [Gemmatimonadales bacterium]